uniref:Adenylate kinase isoenzyme 1 n=1 Tax=Cacopsylla melanoneura TaxID=428564 RepID=A0A8D8T6K8_9HEMI
MLAELDNAKVFLIDGYPRNVDQANVFVEQTKMPMVILYLDAPDDVILARLMKRGETSGRSDDNEKAIRRRLENAIVNDEPILKTYNACITKIDTNKKLEDIFPKVEAALKDRET